MQMVQSRLFEEGFMTYYVTMKVEGRYTAEVEATSLEEAKQKAEADFAAADLNRIEFIDTEYVHATDARGNYIEK